MLCSLSIFVFPTVGQSHGKLYPSAANAVLMEEVTGRVLFEKDAHEKRPIASITKIMTALVAIQYGDIQDEVKVTKRAVETTGSSIYLQENEQISLEDLLYGLMLRSGNDASIAIAEHVGGSVEGFVFLMNQTAASIGMTDTHFMNPHGLDEEGHYSTAYDMALLMRYAMGNGLFQRISSTTSHQAKVRDYPWRNKNKLLTQLYEPCTGGKTGFTRTAGRTLVTTAKKEQLSFIAVTLNGPDDWNDHMMLYEWGFDHFLLKKLDSNGKKSFRSNEETVTGYISEDVFYPVQEGEEDGLRKEVMLGSPFENEQDQIGIIRYLFQDEPIKEVPVYKKYQNGWFLQMKQFLLDIMLVKDDG
jgi:D-alanyl-D-alanine carboxypeptidase